MPKDSQIDPKEMRRAKAKNEVTSATESVNKSKNKKKQSAKRGDV